MSLDTSRREGCSKLFLGLIRDEQYYGELVAYGDFSFARRAVDLFSIGRSPVVKVL